jgi:hypothetical protein
LDFNQITGAIQEDEELETEQENLKLHISVQTKKQAQSTRKRTTTQGRIKKGLPVQKAKRRSYSVIVTH